MVDHPTAPRVLPAHAPPPAPPTANASSGASSVPASAAASAQRIQDTPEFKSAVADAVSHATDDILARLKAVAPDASGPDLVSFTRMLAMAIAEVSDPNNKRRIAPEEAEKRRAGKERMDALIAKYQAEYEAGNDDALPSYELLREVFLEERLVKATYTGTDHIQRKTQIGWPHIPNEAMRPLNAAAQDIHGAFLQWIGGQPHKVTHSAGKAPRHQSLKVMHEPVGAETPHVGRPRGGDLRILGRETPGAVVETNVLGTAAAPARQLA
jgi:hypothetical protein